FLLDWLAHIDGRMTPLEIGAAARAAGSLGPHGRRFAPYLLCALTEWVGDDEFSLDRYSPDFPPEEATTVQLQAGRALGRVCSAGDRAALDLLDKMARGQDGLDPRVVREAHKALEIIQQKTPKSGQGEEK